MPNRIIKESIRTSKTVNSLSDFQFRLWVYLITYVDDYGRGSADPELLKGFVFPRRKRVSESDIKNALAELAGMGCIILYEVDGESYFYFPNWGEHQRIQTKKSKYPAPDDGILLEPTVSHGELPPESESNPNTNPNPNTDNTRKRAFVSPTLDEIKAYCAERNSNVDPVAFFNFFTTPNERGETWVDSRGNKVKNWKQKLLTWEGHSVKTVGKKSHFMDYKQRKCTEAELNGMGNNLLEVEQ